MNTWTSGYVTDISYTFGYYNELNPSRLRLAFLNAGLHYPEVTTACELGFGQGMSTNIHAAASIIRWFGTDFNPSQAGFAQELSEISGSGARLYDDSFNDFVTRTDLPDFDYIGIHGIWSWISDENRKVLTDFISKKLKVGGVLYISYNTQPGWAVMAPIRELLTEHSQNLGAPGNHLVSRIDDALEFAEKFIATTPAYVKANPHIVDRIKKIKEQNRNYLAHEYFNKDWLPMSFSCMAERLKASKLNYACSAHYLDLVDPINLTAEQKQFLNEIPDPIFRQTVRDFIINQQFRRDYWIKGARPMTGRHQIEQLRNQRFVLLVPRDEVPMKIVGSLGESNLQEAIYAPVLDALADHKTKSFYQLEQAVANSNISIPQLFQVVLVLAGSNTIALVQNDIIANKVKKTTNQLNNYLCLKARDSSDIAYLASPVTGGGIMVGRFQQLFILAMTQGCKTTAELAEYVWQIFSTQNERINKDGKPLESAEENLNELNKQAERFNTKILPIFKALRIC